MLSRRLSLLSTCVLVTALHSESPRDPSFLARRVALQEADAEADAVSPDIADAGPSTRNLMIHRRRLLFHDNHLSDPVFVLVVDAIALGLDSSLGELELEGPKEELEELKQDLQQHRPGRTLPPKLLDAIRARRKSQQFLGGMLGDLNTWKAGCCATKRDKKCQVDKDEDDELTAEEAVAVLSAES